MNNTPNYGYNLPEYLEDADVVILNQNFTAIDKDILDVRQIVVLMYDSSSTYNTDDLVGYENPTDHHIRMFRCLADNVTGAWDSTKWTNTNVAAELLRRSGGGTEVEANPTGTATDTLTKIRIGNTIYAVSSGVTALEDLTDVDLSNLTTGQILVWDGNDWVNSDPIGGASDLSDLDDVSITSPSDGDVLEYDNGDWVNKTPTPVSREVEGNPIEVSDSADAPLVKCVSEIQGSQDLHGYDKPWVGGAGANKWDEEWEQGAYDTTTGLPIASSSRIRSKNPIYVMPSTTYYGLCANRLAIRIFYYDANGNHISNEQVNNTSFTTPNDVSYIHFMSSSAYGTTYNNDIAINYPSTVTTYEPYSNICPITAYTEGKIEVRGKNMLPNKMFQYNTYNVFIGKEQETDDDVWLNPGTYTLQIDCTNTTYHINYGVNGGGAIIVSGVAPTEWTFTVTEKSSYRFWLNDATGITVAQVKNFQLVKGSESLPYEPYTSTTHTTTFPSAIYRGSEDVVNGEVTSEFLLADMGDLTYMPIQDSGGRFYSDSLKGIIKNVNYSSEVTSAKCSCYESTTGSIAAQKIIDGSLGVDGVGRIYFYDSSMDGKTAVQIKTALTGQQLAYELTTPTTSSVTPTNLPIKSLSGYNHIESSTGDMEIEYITGKYNPIIEIAEREIKTIDEMLTENIESSMTASSNYTSGELIIACGKIYRATANIASGSSLTVGTNVTQTTIEAEIARSGGGVNYSTTEHVVGTWIDGSPVYEKVYEFSSTFTMANGNQWYNTSFSRGDIDLLIDIVGVQNGGAVYSGLIAGFDSGYISLLTYRYTDLDAFILRYTKSS